jgi:hypothetical protein
MTKRPKYPAKTTPPTSAPVTPTASAELLKTALSDELLAALDAEGFVIVPVEPTNQMLSAGRFRLALNSHDALTILWRDMIAVARRK